MSTEENASCDTCEGRGWHHMSEPFEIERCDSCAPKGWDDRKAAQKHREDCGCDWPDIDYQHMVVRASLFDQPRNIVTSISVILDEFGLVAMDRENFVSQLPRMMKILGRAYTTYLACAEEQDAKYPLLETLSFLASTLVVISSLKIHDQLPDHWFWSFEDGKVIEGKWRAKKAARPSPYIQSCLGDISIPSADSVVWDISALHEKLRSIGVTVTVLHDEVKYDIPDERTSEAMKLVEEISRLRMKEILGKVKPVPSFPIQATLEREIVATPTPQKEFDYKQVYKALKSVKGKGAWDDFELGMVKRLILRSFPDADT